MRGGTPQLRLSLVLPSRSGRSGADQSTFFKNRHGRFRACDLHRLLFEQVVARCAMPGLVAGRYVAVDGSTIMADASREKKLKGTDAANELRARDIVLRPVPEYLAGLDAALPPSLDERAPRRSDQHLADRCGGGAHLQARTGMLRLGDNATASPDPLHLARFTPKRG